jgi:hypothetical protein
MELHMNEYMALTSNDDDITSDSVIFSDFALLCCVPLRDGCDVLDVIARRMDAEPT